MSPPLVLTPSLTVRLNVLVPCRDFRYKDEQTAEVKSKVRTVSFMQLDIIIFGD